MCSIKLTRAALLDLRDTERCWMQMCSLTKSCQRAGRPCPSQSEVHCRALPIRICMAQFMIVVRLLKRASLSGNSEQRLFRQVSGSSRCHQRVSYAQLYTQHRESKFAASAKPFHVQEPIDANGNTHLNREGRRCNTVR